ncbi:hypothetical protein DNTS_013653 [Danionella cerebrum]|uniref:C2 domain-containing protein n=1 Tax=Danionella cerebrum TaxID=2873325 RepID=A0A553N4G9_9TELE|nr:hypothetical protein DNTS_013653 [Danionella translucida]
MASRHRLPSRNTEEAVVPLMKYLEKELQYMNENLVQDNFNSLLTPLWMNSVKILQQMSQQEDSNLVYFQRLLYSLQAGRTPARSSPFPPFRLSIRPLKPSIAHYVSTFSTHNPPIFLCLNSDRLTLTGGIPISGIFCLGAPEEFYSATLDSFPLQTNTTSDRPQGTSPSAPLGHTCTYSIFTHFAGSSDPFVQLSLEPRHVFPQIESRSTKIKNCELNPLFEESFEFLVSLEQCQSPGACLLLTVLDHDTLRSDDFEGEAFLSLKAVPGIGGGSNNPEPAQIRLPLMHPKPNSENTLRILEGRKGEKEAQAFVKLRRLREKKSQEA